MTIVFATYIDNQREIDYPIKFISSKIKGLRVYSSDEENQKYLLEQGIESSVIGIKIKQPIDISVAQNACVNDIFSRMNCDFIVWVQADIHITQQGYKIIQDFCTVKNIGRTCALGLLHIKLFHLCGYSYYGVNVIGRESWDRIKFTGDGAYLGAGGADYCEADYNDATIDIGYLTIDQCRRHLNQHQKTWKSTNLASTDDTSFTKDIVSKNNHKGLITEDSQYFELIKEMGLVEEYNKVKQICEM